MTGKLRQWKEKDGRFWARIAVPATLRPFLDNPRSELLEPLGGDSRVALRLHPAAVAKLQHEIALAERRANLTSPAPLKPVSPRTPITTADFGGAVWHRYTAALEADDAVREKYPNRTAIEAEYVALRKKIETGEVSTDPPAILDALLDFSRLKKARELDQFQRETRLAALERQLAENETHQVEHEIDDYLEKRSLAADEGTAVRSVLAKQMMRAEIEALHRTL